MENLQVLKVKDIMLSRNKINFNLESEVMKL